MATTKKAAPKAPAKKAAPVRKAKVMSQVGSEIELELVKVLSAEPQGADEDRADFLSRLANGVNDDVDEEGYEALSDEVKEWFGGAVKAMDKNKPIPEFQDAEEQEPAEEEEPAPKSSKPSKTGAAKSSKAPAKKAAAKDSDARPQGEGYAGHRPGTKAEKAHKIMDELLKKGKDRSDVMAAWDKIEISDATKNTWFQKFKNW